MLRQPFRRGFIVFLLATVRCFDRVRPRLRLATPTCHRNLYHVRVPPSMLILLKTCPRQPDRRPARALCFTFVLAFFTFESLPMERKTLHRRGRHNAKDGERKEISRVCEDAADGPWRRERQRLC